MEDRSDYRPEGMSTTGPVLVPRVDELAGERIYSPTIARLAGVGAFAGALLLGLPGLALASGWMPIAGLGQWAAAGEVPAAFAAAGVGAALGALVGALVGVYRLPRR